MGEIAAGTMQEEIGRLLGYGGAVSPHDVERAKYVLSQWLEDNGVILYLQTPVAEVWKAGENVRGLVVSTPRGVGPGSGPDDGGRHRDGTAAALAGRPTRWGAHRTAWFSRPPFSLPSIGCTAIWFARMRRTIRCWTG